MHPYNHIVTIKGNTLIESDTVYRLLVLCPAKVLVRNIAILQDFHLVQEPQTMPEEEKFKLIRWVGTLTNQAYHSEDGLTIVHDYGSLSIIETKLEIVAHLWSNYAEVLAARLAHKGLIPELFVANCSASEYILGSNLEYRGMTVVLDIDGEFEYVDKPKYDELRMSMLLGLCDEDGERIKVEEPFTEIAHYGNNFMHMVVSTLGYACIRGASGVPCPFHMVEEITLGRK